MAAGVFILLFAVGAVSHGFSALAGLELARRGLFIVGALALLVSAGALLLPEKAASVREKDGWTARFGRFGLFGCCSAPPWLFCSWPVCWMAGCILHSFEVMPKALPLGELARQRLRGQAR